MGRNSEAVVGIDLNSPNYSADSKQLVRRIMQEMGLKVTRLVESRSVG